jgi:hypothetical protein
MPRAGILVEQVCRELRRACKTMLGSPTVFAAAAVALAVGIAANVTVISLLRILVLRPLPARSPDQFVQLLHQYPGRPTNTSAIIRQCSPVFLLHLPLQSQLSTQSKMRKR